MSRPDAAFYADLEALLGRERFLDDPADCWPYGYDNSRRHHPPDAVAFPAGHDDVRELVRACNRHGVCIVARGRGTGTTGAAVPTRGGLVISTERMDRILRFEPADRLMVVETGISNQAVQDAAREGGFFWPPDPTSAAFCSVGGNLAYNSAGPRAVKYGTPRENVLGLRAVTGAGDEIRTGVGTSKGVVGYDLTRLLIGSEGTLAIITEATLRLTPIAEATRTLRAFYRSIHAASQAVARIMAQPATPCALEFLDGRSLDMIRDYSEATLPASAGALLMIEVDGPESALDAAVAAIRTAATVDGLIDFAAARDSAEAAALWATRKALSPALRKVAPKKVNEDVVVPVSRIPELIAGLDALATEFDVPIVNFGHAGNGNIHVNLLIDPDDTGQMARATPCLSRVFDLVLALGGTLSGEHGVGLEKQAFIARELDPASIALMRRIKADFDPQNILNPGKLLPV